MPVELDPDSASCYLNDLICGTQREIELHLSEDTEAALLLAAIEVAGDSSEAQLLKSLDVSGWLLIFAVVARPLRPCESGQPLTQAWDVAGAVVAWNWQRNEESGLILASYAVRSALIQGYRKPLVDVLAFLSPGQVQRLSHAVPESAPRFCELLLAAAIRFNRGEMLDYIDPLLEAPTHNPICLEYLRAVMAAHWRGDLTQLSSNF